MDLSYFSGDKGTLRDIWTLPLFKRSSFDLLLASFGINVLYLALPIILMQVYDRIVPTKATYTLLWLVIGFFCALTIESILRLCRATITNWISARFEHNLAYSCVTRWLTSNLDEFERDGAGVHLDRLRAVSTLKSFYAGQAFQLILDLPFALLFLSVIGFLGGWQVAAFAGGAALVFLIVIGVIRSRYSIYRLKQKNIADRRYNFLVEALSGIHTIKAITIEESMLRRHERLEADGAKADYDVIFIGNLPVSIGNMFSQIILFGVLFFGGSLAIQGMMTLGSLAACTLLSGRFFSPFKSLASFWVRHADIQLAKKQIKSIADLGEEYDPNSACLPDEIAGVIQLKTVSFRYDDESPLILDNVNFHVSKNHMVCLNTQGSRGTTTLLNLIYGMLPPTDGEVVVDGIDLADVCHNDYKGRMEYIPQNGTLFNGTIFENLTLFNPAHRDAALDAASLLGLDSVLSELPLGYETQVGNRLFEFLPSGVIQRICLARSLAIRPRIMLMDRASYAMDAESLEHFYWMLDKLKGNCTMVIATADPVVMSKADSVYSIQDGRLVRQEAEQCF